MLKKTTIAVLGILASNFAFAGSMGPVCTPGNVTVPCETKQWSFGLNALYLQPVEGTPRDYRFNSLTTMTNIENTWNWGFLATGSYQFNTGNDISVNWTHLSGTEKQIFPIANLLGEPRYNLTKEDRFDQVNAVLGQHVDLDLVQKMRFYGGLQYASIQGKADNYYPDPFANPGISFTSANYYNNSDFKGVGPVVGIDYSYDISPQISLIANGSTALMFGTSRLSRGIIIQPTNIVAVPFYTTSKNIVSSFEAKLGANYAYTMAQGVLNLQGGYQVTQYMNPLKGFSLEINLPEFTDFGLYGPYIGVKYVGNA